MRITLSARYDAPVLDERFEDMVRRQFDNSEDVMAAMRDCPHEMSVLAFTALRTLDAASKE